MNRVRVFAEDDICDVVTLRRKCFEHSNHASDSALADYFYEVFFLNPWHSSDFPSLVFESGHGKISGFLGVVPRPMSMKKGRLWLAVPTQFMIEPGHSGLAAIQLLKKFLSGPQDISITDVSTDSARRVWEGLGGSTAHLYSCTWVRPLRPANFRNAQLGRHGVSRVLTTSAKPFSALVDIVLNRMTSSPYHMSRPPGESASLGVEEWITLYETLPYDYRFRPEYDRGTLAWLMDKLREGLGGYALRKFAVRDSRGAHTGWYSYIAKPGTEGQVVQMFALANSAELVVQHLSYDAWEHGCIAVTGRMQPEYLQALAGYPGYVARRGPWFLVHARDSKILNYVMAGEVMFSRLEGEWWLNF